MSKKPAARMRGTPASVWLKLLSGSRNPKAAGKSVAAERAGALPEAADEVPEVVEETNEEPAAAAASVAAPGGQESSKTPSRERNAR